MAKNQQNEDESLNFDSDTKFYQSDIHSLSIVVGDPDTSKGEVAPNTVSFEPYLVQEIGREGWFKRGFLATSEGSALKALENDPNVTEISQDEYTEIIQNSQKAAK